uniref:Uncharacterized protein n=1 Tax=Sphaerodactylus townsendi TaxID=933632 RepID=A0ACB8EVP3_9SAUR
MPKEHKAKICMWKYLDVHSMDLIDKAQTTDELKSLLSELLSLQDFPSNPRSAILLDLYFYCIQFCLKQGFNREQTSAFFSIVKDTHEACVETPLPNVEECYKYFTELVFCHSIRRPPFSIDLFSQDQLVLIADYMINTYFRHFKLYKYAFTPQVRLDVSFSYVGMPEPKEEDPTAALREYISAQLNQELAQLHSVGESSHTTGLTERNNSVAKLVTQLEKGSKRPAKRQQQKARVKK